MLGDVCINRVMTKSQRESLARLKEITHSSFSSSSSVGVSCPVEVNEVLQYFKGCVMKQHFPHIEYEAKRQAIIPVTRAITAAIEIMLENLTVEAFMFKEEEYVSSRKHGGREIRSLFQIFEQQFSKVTIEELSITANQGCHTISYGGCV
jgi:hypothetical protein